MLTRSKRNNLQNKRRLYSEAIKYYSSSEESEEDDETESEQEDNQPNDGEIAQGDDEYNYSSPEEEFASDISNDDETPNIKHNKKKRKRNSSPEEESRNTFESPIIIDDQSSPIDLLTPPTTTTNSKSNSSHHLGDETIILSDSSEVSVIIDISDFSNNNSSCSLNQCADDHQHGNSPSSPLNYPPSPPHFQEMMAQPTLNEKLASSPSATCLENKAAEGSEDHEPPLLEPIEEFQVNTEPESQLEDDNISLDFNMPQIGRSKVSLVTSELKQILDLDPLDNGEESNNEENVGKLLAHFGETDREFLAQYAKLDDSKKQKLLEYIATLQ